MLRFSHFPAIFCIFFNSTKTCSLHLVFFRFFACKQTQYYVEVNNPLASISGFNINQMCQFFTLYIASEVVTEDVYGDIYRIFKRHIS